MSELYLSCLGKMGWFGNQLFQYSFAKSFCQQNGLILRTPGWIGQKIFKTISDPLIPSPIPTPYKAVEQIPEDSNVDLEGYFQDQKFLNFYSREWCRNTFEIKEEYDHKEMDNDYIAVHLRRGDYRNYPTVYATIEKEAYEKFLSNFDFNMPIVFVEGSVPDIGSHYNDTSFMKDFNILRNAKVLVRSNSTFSWWAHVLGREDQVVYSPVVDDIAGPVYSVNFVKGNHPKFTKVLNTDLYLKEN